MATCASRLGLGALFVRTFRIKLARIVMRAAGGFCRRICGGDDAPDVTWTVTLNG